MKVEDQILLSTLAASDALWLCDRRVDDRRRHTLIYERRCAYFAGGVVLQSLSGDGADAAERQRASRAVQGLVQQGLLTAAKPRYARTSAMRLTNSGDAYARALVGLPGMPEAVGMMKRLAELAATPIAMDVAGFVYSANGAGSEGLAYVLEHVLADLHGWADGAMPRKAIETLWDLEDALLPAMVRGLVVAAADPDKHAHYALTTAGRAFLEGGAKIPRAKLPRYSKAAFTFYDQRLASELNQLKTAAPAHPNEIGEMPLSVAHPSPRPGCDEAEAAFIEGGIAGLMKWVKTTGGSHERGKQSEAAEAKAAAR